MRLLRRVEVYAPEALGLCDILLCGRRIERIGTELSCFMDLPGVEVIDGEGLKAVPGYIDHHMHITGGGGEGGFTTRMPEASIEELVSAGVTTVMGVLGTDSITRSLEALYAKANALEQEGITAYMLTGSYSYPCVTLTKSVCSDVVLIDKVIGVKIAASDHRSSNISNEEFIRLCGEARVGGMISGKPGLTVVHMGEGKRGFELLRALMENSDIPASAVLPTHVGRSEKVFQEAIAYARAGGNIDLTAGQDGTAEKTAEQVMEALRCGVRAEQLTITSDSYGSQTVFDENKRCIGMTYITPSILHKVLKELINKGMAIEKALAFFTANAAVRIGQERHKGRLAEGYDADITFWDDKNDIAGVMAKGKLLLWRGELRSNKAFAKC